VPAALLLADVRLSLGGRVVLDSLSLSAAAGAVTAVLGPNGAGKTTMIRCCTGTLVPDGGRIEVLGSPAGSAAANDRVGLMPQSTGAWSGVKPRELLAYLASLYATPLPPRELATALGIDAFAGTPYRRLSGGQQQLVNLAGAIIGRPELVFLDEPTAGLDPHVRRQVWTLIRDLRAAGVAVVLTTHAMDEAEQLADHVVLLDHGRPVAAGTVTGVAAGRSLEQAFLDLTAGPEVAAGGSA
jgi:ABC-2 type transport system ATP-binding protein